MVRYVPPASSLSNLNSTLYEDRVHADVPNAAIELTRDSLLTTDPAISMSVVDTIASCLDPFATGSRCYYLRVATVNGNVSIAGSTGSPAVRDAYRKCLARAKAEVKGINGIDDIAVVHASDPRPERGEGLMDITASYVDLRMRSILSPTCAIRVDHANQVIFIRGSVLYNEDYEIVSGFQKNLPNQWAHISKVDISDVLNVGCDKPLPK
ncbi:hypothetical protein [Stenotrophomonas sp.]|uniref:hypothetical protein n=1 Tax=Stenotrophomonas sp. TaxID=69392 RepID=UPI0028AD13FC|nr:hypothetical protein [Stenotrophomonas sp.]